MKNSTKPNEILKEAKDEFDLAQNKYRAVFRTIQPLAKLDVLPPPPLMRAAYSDRMAWIMANMAKLAYIRFEESEIELERLEFALRSGAFNLIKTFDKNDTQAFIARNDEYTVLCFRGTQPDKWADIRTDAKAIKQKTINGKVHVGFNTAFGDVKDEIVHELRKNIGDKMPIYITGHSLGAALATVATKELENEFSDQIAACYTFGSPRVGDGEYEKSIKAPFYRIVNTTDIVTLIPYFFGSYVHVGDTRYLSRRKVNGAYLLYRGMPYFIRTIECIIETLIAILRLTNPLKPWIGAHSMDGYIEKLESYAAKRNDVIKPVEEVLLPAAP